MQFETVQLDLQPGDVISSKLGIVQKGFISKKKYLVKKMKYQGDGRFIVIGEKEELEG